MHNRNNCDTIWVEDYDIKNRSKDAPNMKIGVRIGRIYSQIALLNGLPNKLTEIAILINALQSISSATKRNSDIYIPMRIVDINKCFHSRLTSLPKNTFAYYSDSRQNEQDNTRG